ncbi:hypothetical protein BHM03_00043412 [Ensete ventricosum]|uniref:Uncharacterized protein n=1 Tax=Ensete ventricosum TaxID=4639 RepID=A0A445MKQ6_ENSVE|nr:hypothetical protein BHM03_00043412 [Ensete ventricosum]
MTSHPGESSLPDGSPIACRRGHCTLVGRCACPDTPPIASCQRSGGTIRRSTTAPALTRRLLPTTKGYYSPIGCRACPNTPYVASCRGSGRGLVWHVDSAAPPVDRGDSWSATGPSEDTPRSGRAEDVGSTWLRCGCYVARHVALDHYWPHHSPPHPPTPPPQESFSLLLYGVRLQELC